MVDDADVEAEGQAPFAVGAPDARGYIWYAKVNVPWSPLALPVPVAHMDRPPETAWETETFTFKPANQWDYWQVAVDVPATRALINDFIDVFSRNRFVGLLG